jgi:hypothetical protein
MPVQLLKGTIGYFYTYAVNDFEAMTVGTVTTLSGATVVGDCAFGTAQFGQR